MRPSQTPQPQPDEYDLILWPQTSWSVGQISRSEAKKPDFDSADDADSPLSQKWLEEIARRSAEYDAGLAETVPWEQIRDAALRRAGLSARERPQSEHDLT
jgi:hypothetical protein